MREYKIHDDGCDELLVDGFCHRCGFVPDMQSTAWVSAYPARRDLMRERDTLRVQLASAEKERDEERIEREKWQQQVEMDHRGVLVEKLIADRDEWKGQAQLEAAHHAHLRKERDAARADLAACKAERDEAREMLAWLDRGGGLGLDVHKRIRAVLDDTSRCAICGWPLAPTPEDGCMRGNCSRRPRPDRPYAPDRAELERPTQGEVRFTGLAGYCECGRRLDEEHSHAND